VMVWRICRAKYAAAALSGAGGLRYGARWHWKGTRIVYTAGSLSLAALEYFVNLAAGPIAEPLAAIPVEIPESVKVVSVGTEQLPENWRAHPIPAQTRRVGSEWVEGGRSAVLAVPSVVIPSERNYLLNPAHSEFKKIRVGKPERFGFDSRMWKGSG
jgi:RES domain-containing protein